MPQQANLDPFVRVKNIDIKCIFMFMMTNVSVGTENKVETFLNKYKLHRYVEKDVHIYTTFLRNFHD